MSTIVLVSCGAKKADHEVPAKDMYVGTLFKASRQYTEEILEPDQWFIISAKHGLVHPDTVIAPYNLTLKTMSKTDRMLWGQKVRKQLIDAGFDLQKDTFIVLAGSAYTDPLRPHLRKMETPLAKMKLGESIHWLQQKVIK